MCDTRTIMHGQRFFLSNNDLDPKIYEVTKIKDINPQGIIKLSIKQHELNTKRDNIELRICDFYTDNGDIQINDISATEIPNDAKYSEIHWMFVNDNGELDYGNDTSLKTLQIGQTSYFKAVFSDEDIDAQWRIELDNEEVLGKDDVAYYEGLMKITKFDSTTIALKPGKASSLKGKKFVLFVSDINGEYASSIPVEVSE